MCLANIATLTTLHPPYQVAKAEKLKPMEMELRRLEDLAESIVNDFAYMRAREQEMRDTNGRSFHLLEDNCSSIIHCRINQLACPLLQRILYDLFGVPCCLAAILPSSFFPSKKTDRVVDCLHSIQMHSHIQYWPNEGFIHVYHWFIVISFQGYFMAKL